MEQRNPPARQARAALDAAPDGPGGCWRTPGSWSLLPASLTRPPHRDTDPAGYARWRTDALAAWSEWDRNRSAA